MTRVAVVGQGFAGLCSALVLARRGLKATLLGPASDDKTASTAAHGASTVKGLLESSQALFDLKMRGHAGFLAWLGSVEEDAGVAVPKIFGVFEPFWSLKDFQSSQERIYKRRFLGPFARTSAGEHPFFGAFSVNFYPKDFWIDTDLYLKALRLACLARGVEMGSVCRVARVQEETTGIKVSFSDETSRHFDKVVVCAGAGNLAISGIDLPLFAVPGATFTLPVESPALQTFCAVKGLSAVAFYAGMAYVGSTTEDHKRDGEAKDPPLEKYRNECDDILNALFAAGPPGLEAERSEVRYGVRVRTRTREPVFGRATGCQNIFLNTGYYKSGVTLTPIGAGHIAELICQD